MISGIINTSRFSESIIVNKDGYKLLEFIWVLKLRKQTISI